MTLGLYKFRKYAALVRIARKLKNSQLYSSASDQKQSIMSAAQSSTMGSNGRPQPTSTAESDLGTFDILNVQSRVVTPPRSLPLQSFPPEETLIDELFGAEFNAKALDVASRLGFGPNSIVEVGIKLRGLAQHEC